MSLVLIGTYFLKNLVMKHHKTEPLERSADAIVITGKRIKNVIKEKKIPQNVVADKADISKSYLHLIKAGVFDPPVKTVARIAKAIGVKISDLKKRRDNGDSK